MNARNPRLEEVKAARHKPARGRPARRGSAAMLAMAYLVLFATLSGAMYAMASLNVQTGRNISDVDRARAAAESGLRWFQYRIQHMSRPKTTIGNITSAVADSLWPSIRTAITNDMASNLVTAERAVTFNNNILSTASTAVDGTSSRFVVTITQDTDDKRILRVRSTGTYGLSSRSVSMAFKVDKKVKFAVVGKVPIQVGRNVMVDGPIAMTTAAKYPPVYMLSDFRSLTSSLTGKIDSFEAWLKANHTGYDNRVDVRNSVEFARAQSANYSDYNGDGYIDEFDLFLKEFDTSGDHRISQAEFTNSSTGKLYDADLFAVIDSLGGPEFDGDVTRAGYQDNTIASNDGYLKVRGGIEVATTATAWNNNLSGGQTVINQIPGPIATNDPLTPPVKFGITTNDVFDLTPSNFDTTSYKNRTGPAAGTTVKTATLIQNKVLAASDANGTAVTERTPYGSTSYQATYRRPVFRNMTFTNVQIPKGLNALFDNCTFQGVTYVDVTTNITNGSGQTTTSASDGMTWSKRMYSGTFAAGTALTATTSKGFTDGNNLRFNDCTFNGPITSSVPTAYTHFTNSWEFTGATMFDNQVDQTATIICPNTNIEMGSFTNPGTAPSTLVGVVVAGNIDIRGSSAVDGSIIITGDGAGNTTLGWFGASDGTTDPTSPMPEGGWGKINLHYNPHRTLPDGINVAIDITPDPTTYQEGS
jgi:Tfp pilus assembly protein PilX